MQQPNKENSITETLKQAQFVYSNTQDQIKFADTKTGFLVALMSLLIGFGFNNYAKLAPLTANCYYAGIIVFLSLFVVITMYLCFTVYFPRHDCKTTQTSVFFMHITQQYDFEFLKYNEIIKGFTSEDWLREYSAQIVEISHIAKHKHKRFKVAAIFGGIAILMSVLLVTILALSQPTITP